MPTCFLNLRFAAIQPSTKHLRFDLRFDAFSTCFLNLNSAHKKSPTETPRRALKLQSPTRSQADHVFHSADFSRQS
jgi:hypothetical protein